MDADRHRMMNKTPLLELFKSFWIAIPAAFHNVVNKRVPEQLALLVAYLALCALVARYGNS